VSWSLSRPNVALRVTKFAPVTEPKPIAGLSPIARALWRDKRAKEQQKRLGALVLNSKS
jgi:hypothetical protein